MRAKNGAYLELEEDDVNVDLPDDYDTNKPDILSPPEI